MSATDGSTEFETTTPVTGTATEATSGQKEGGLPQLNPESFSSQLFWLTLTFVIFYVLVSRHAMPRIAAVVEGRQSKMASDLAAAEAMSQQAEAARLAYESELAATRQRAAALIDESKMAGEQLAKQQHVALDQTLAKKLAEADKSLREQCTRIERDMAPIAEEAAGLIVEKVLGRKPGEEQVRKTVKTAAR